MRKENRTLYISYIIEMKFKKEFTIQQRIDESSRIRSKYPDRVPIICEKLDGGNNTIQEIDKKKYLVPYDLTCGQFAYVIRKRMKMQAEQAIYLFVKGVIPSSSALINAVYNDYKDDDGFLYISYNGENTFGTNL